MRGRNWELCWGGGKVWEWCGRLYGVSVEVVLKWGKVCWDAERYGDVGEPTHSSTPLPTPSTLDGHLFPHSPNTSPPHSPNTSLHTFSHSPPTSPHFPTPLTPFLHLSQHFPTLTPLTFSQPPRLLQHFPILPYFIIYPMPKFLTFFIYCQISLTIKYTRSSP